MLLLLLIVMLSASTLSTCSSLAAVLRNKRIAEQTGLQIVVNLIDPRNPVWLALQAVPVTKHLLEESHLSFIRLNRASWNFHDKFRTHLEFGKVFIHVTPSGNEVWVADASVCAPILGRRRDFGKPVWVLEKEGNPDLRDYRESPTMVLDNLLRLALIPKLMSKYSFFKTDGSEKLSLAAKRLKQCMVGMVEARKIRLASEAVCSDDLLSTMVRRSEEAQVASLTAGTGDMGQGRGLSNDEIHGNLFLYTLVGHESTANRLTYAIYLFAIFPQWQDWVAEEINHVLGDREAIEKMDDKTIFPQLKRCLAVMFETLRLYGPVLSIPKHTGNSPQMVSMNDGRSITIPPHTYVYPNSVALHTHPDYWGSDSLSWQPDRWIESQDYITAASTAKSTSFEEVLAWEGLREPMKGSYIPWADGPRVCPGKKSSQVEFVAVLAVFLGRHRVQVVPSVHETSEQARSRVYRIVEDSRRKLTLQMRDATSVYLRWVEKGNIKAERNSTVHLNDPL